jgi:hypothetical protein
MFRGCVTILGIRRCFCFAAGNKVLVCVVACSVFALPALLAQAEPPYGIDWGRQLGGNNTDESYGLAVDTDGNAFIAGKTYSGLGGSNQGIHDGFLTKYSPSGALLWTRQAAPTGSGDCRGVAIAGTAGVFVSGYTNDEGNRQAFVSRYETSGNLVWSRQLGTSGTDYGRSVAADIAGNVFICGETNGSLGGANQGSNDAFIAKYDSSGSLLWSRQLGTGASDYGQSVAVDATGNAFMTGYTLGALGGPLQGSWDAFIAKYSVSGELLWCRQLGGTSVGQGVAVDAAGDAFVCGYTTAALDGPNHGNNDIFLCKYSISGELLWTRQLGSGGDDWGWAIALDASGNALISGTTNGNLGTNHGNADAFLSKYDPSGTLLWTEQLGTIATDQSYSVAVDSADSTFITGYTKGNLEGSNQGLEDAFLIRLSPVPEPSTLIFVGIGAIGLLGHVWRKRR